MSHGFRKFDTWCTNSGMNQTYVDFCLGHSLPGVKDSYFLPQADSNGVYLDILDFTFESAAEVKNIMIMIIMPGRM